VHACRPLALVAAALLLAGCGGGDKASGEVKQTVDKLGSIRSGNLVLRLVVTPDSGNAGRIGFQLRGPFSVRKGALPLADVAYTQYVGPRAATVSFVSDGKNAWAVSNEKRLQLPDTAVAQVKSASNGLGSGSGTFGAMRIDTWFTDPTVTDGPDGTEHVSGKLDPVNAANGLLGLLAQLGRPSPTIEGDSADQLRKAVKSSSLDLWTGKDDKLLRRLRLKARIGFDVPAQLKAAIGGASGATVDFQLAIANPNRPVHVSAP
jgi:hypothetical protein